MARRPTMHMNELFTSCLFICIRLSDKQAVSTSKVALNIWLPVFFLLSTLKCCPRLHVSYCLLAIYDRYLFSSFFTQAAHHCEFCTFSQYLSLLDNCPRFPGYDEVYARTTCTTDQRCFFNSTFRRSFLLSLSIGNCTSRDSILSVEPSGTMETLWYPTSQINRLHQSWFLFQCGQEAERWYSTMPTLNMEKLHA